MEFEPLDFTSETLENESDSTFTPMKNYFRNKTIFLTGGTGFLGQLYIEKLLRSDVKQIYLLARSKRNVEAEERIKNIYCGTHFSKLQKHDPDFLKRIRIIPGDLSELSLGISEANLKDIYNNVEIVLHAAADVRFDEKLLKLLLVNLRGTRELFKICESIKSLQVVSYISTAYSNCCKHKLLLEEKFYDAPVDPNVMIKLAEKIAASNQSDEFEIITQRIIKPWPNTYTYSKSLSEELVRTYRKKFPICIIRPSIVVSTFEDPVPGWCNNIYGLNGVLVACGMGILRIMPMDLSVTGDIICADLVINSTLAAIWYTYKEYEKNIKIQEPQIYHVSTTADRPVTWGELSYEMHQRGLEIPIQKSLWLPCTNSTVCPFMWKYLTIFYHVIPGIFMDLMIHLRRNKQKVLPVYRKVQRFMEALKYFMQNNWYFTNSNMKKVWDSMSPNDKEFYPSDVRRYDFKSFSYIYNRGLRIYIGRQSLEILPSAQRKYNLLRILHFLILCLYYGLHVFIFHLFARQMNIYQKLQDSANNTYAFLLDPLSE